MNLVGIDSETFLFKPGSMAPKMVCLSVGINGESDVIHRRDPACERTLRELMELALSGELAFTGANLPFDVAVWANEWPDMLPDWFRLYRMGAVHDVQVRQKLIDIANGEHNGVSDPRTGLFTEYKYNLQHLAKRYEYPIELDKDTWRLRYSELYPVDVKDWPESAIDYPRHDALAPVWIHERQDESRIRDEAEQNRARFALHLESNWGLRTDPHMVFRFEQAVQARLDRAKSLLLATEVDFTRTKKRTKKGVKYEEEYAVREALLKQKKDGSYSRNLTAAKVYAERWAKAAGVKLRETPKGGIKLDEDSVREYGSEVLIALQAYGSAQTAMNDVLDVKKGVDAPIHTRFEVLKNSGRTGSSKPNVQNFRAMPELTPATEEWTNAKAVYEKDGESYYVCGQRECVIPRAGWVFFNSDVPGLELRTSAQATKLIVGYSTMGDALNEGRDPHAEVGAELLGISVAEAMKRKLDHADTEMFLARQTGKIANFGMDGLLGKRTFVIQARAKYGIVMTEEEADAAIQSYYRKWPEKREFHQWVKTQCNSGGGYGWVTHPFSNRIQGMVRPTVMANTYMQGLGADACKAACFDLAEACYVRTGPLRGSRPVNFIHDEFLTETLEENLDEKAAEYARIIVEAVNRYLPDYPVPLESMAPVACRRWSKNAEEVRNPDGSLGVWEWPQWREQEGL